MTSQEMERAGSERDLSHGGRALRLAEAEEIDALRLYAPENDPLLSRRKTLAISAEHYRIMDERSRTSLEVVL